MKLLFFFGLSLALHFWLIFVAGRPTAPLDFSIGFSPKVLDLRIETRLSKVIPAKESKVIHKKKPKKTVQQKIVKEKKKKTAEYLEQVSPKQMSSRSSGSAKSQVRSVSNAEYLSNDPPEYPPVARRRGQQGIVILLVKVDALGGVISVKIEKSSGFTVLDQSAVETVSNWRFTPSTKEGIKTASDVKVPVNFKLE